MVNSRMIRCCHEITYYCNKCKIVYASERKAEECCEGDKKK